MPTWVEALLDHRRALLAALLVLAALTERALGRRPATRSAIDRWWLGIGLWALGSLLMTAGPHLEAFGPRPMADWPIILQAGLVFLLADGIHYVVHRLMHAIPWLWRIHRVHHADADYDAATALRFHPFEWVLSAAPLLPVMAWLAPAAEAGALAFAAIMAWNVIQHMDLGRIRIWERWLGPWLLTPALHREHHAREPARSLGNYGLLLSVWDRLFGTWRAPRANVAVGVAGWAHGEHLIANLASPFARDGQPQGPAQGVRS
ncbi:MAG: sterol desaturase family protein [Rhodocyclaceae bacterium]|nr:sterol desaturase family protein [Rhodocyclaceae bacterium]